MCYILNTCQIDAFINFLPIRNNLWCIVAEKLLRDLSLNLFGQRLWVHCMMTSLNGNIFRVTGLWCREFTGEFLHKSQWHRALMFSLICAWTNSWANNGDAGYLRRHRANYDVIVMVFDRVNILWSEQKWFSFCKIHFKMCALVGKLYFDSIHWSLFQLTMYHHLFW